jgi:hypothetical protein
MTDMILEVKATVARVIASKINNKPVPQPIAQFLQSPWQEVLKIIGLREGCEGETWDAAVRLVDDLIWSVQPKLMLQEKRRLLALIPRLIHALREGLALICCEPQEINLFIKGLEQLHIQCMCPAQFNTEGLSQATVSQSVREEILQDAARHAEKQQSFQLDIADPVLLKSRFFHIVNNMALGTWVEFQERYDGKRGKLAWKCDFTGEFTFLDRMCKVIADVPIRDLVQLLERGKARIINDVSLLDRAVDAVMGGMKHSFGRENGLAGA